MGIAIIYSVKSWLVCHTSQRQSILWLAKIAECFSIPPPSPPTFKYFCTHLYICLEQIQTDKRPRIRISEAFGLRGTCFLFFSFFLFFCAKALIYWADVHNLNIFTSFLLSLFLFFLEEENNVQERKIRSTDGWPDLVLGSDAVCLHYLHMVHIWRE